MLSQHQGLSEAGRNIIIIIIGIQPLGRFGQKPELRSGDWYGSGTLHAGQVLGGSLPLLSPGRNIPMKNSNYTIGNRNSDLTACRAVPQPTAPTSALSLPSPIIFHCSFPQMSWNKATFSGCCDSNHVTCSALKHPAHRPLSNAAHNCKCEIHTISLPLYKCICQNHYRHREQCNLLFGCRIKLN